MKKLFLLFTAIIAMNTVCISRTLTVENVYQCILENGILEPEYVLAQSCLETGWYKSHNCRMRNNLFGFRYSGWVTEGNSMGYKVFKNWEESVLYYKNWQVRKGYTEGEPYTRFLDRVGYAENPKYISDLLSVKRRIKTKYGIG